MNQSSHVDLFTNIFQTPVIMMAHMMGSELFWVFIVVLTGIGRWILLHETSLFAGKKDETLTDFEKKKKKRLLFFGRGLIGIGLTFFALLLIILIIPVKH